MSGLDWSHSVRDIPSAGLDIDRSATSDECGILATELEILGVDGMSVRYRISPAGGGRYRLVGQIDARVVQACVVTLEPVPAKISAPFEVHLVPSEAIAGALSANADEAGTDNLEAPVLEPIVNGVVEVGRIVYEELASQLDPYPRKPDANFDWSDPRGSGDDAHPFAGLARLRTVKDGKNEKEQ